MSGSKHAFSAAAPEKKWHLVPGSTGQLALATLVGTNGLAAFPTMGLTSGEIANVPALVSDALPADSDGRRMMMIDASRIAAGQDPSVAIDQSTQGLVEQSLLPTGDVPTPTAASQAYTSLYQEDTLALRLTRRFGWARPGTDGTWRRIGSAT